MLIQASITHDLRLLKFDYHAIHELWLANLLPALVHTLIQVIWLVNELPNDFLLDIYLIYFVIISAVSCPKT
uniref:Putative ovule protein n=1 Tax=Solanum chacoense TaxID=4108 RepID=A0A0V0HDV2_SOLCH